MKKYVLSAVAILMLSACAQQGGAPSEAQVGDNRPSDVAIESATPAEVEEVEEVSADTPLSFGEAFTYEDGLNLTVSAPVAFTPSEYAAAEKRPAYVSFTVTVVNGTKTAFDPSLIHATVQSNNEEADAVFDSQNGFDGSPSTKVLPGREAKFKIGFGVLNPKDLVMEIAPGFEYQDVLYTNT